LSYKVTDGKIEPLLFTLSEVFDANDKYAEVSELVRYFGGGVLDHSHALAAIVAPTTNSYRRLVPGMNPTYTYHGLLETDRP